MGTDKRGSAKKRARSVAKKLERIRAMAGKVKFVEEAGESRHKDHRLK